MCLFLFTSNTKAQTNEYVRQVSTMNKQMILALKTLLKQHKKTILHPRKKQIHPEINISMYFCNTN